MHIIMLHAHLQEFIISFQVIVFFYKMQHIEDGIIVLTHSHALANISIRKQQHTPCNTLAQT